MTNKVLMCGIAILSVGLISCANNNNDNGGGVGPNQEIAVTPQACNIPGQLNCNPGYFNAFGQPWGIQLPFQNNFANGFCGCPQGMRPIMNQQWGLACAPVFMLNFNNLGFVYHTFQFSFFAQNTGWSGVPQANYNPAISGNLSCQVTTACDTRIANACVNGGVCRPVGGGSAIGLCTIGSGIENYNPGFQPAPWNQGGFNNGGFWGGIPR